MAITTNATIKALLLLSNSLHKDIDYLSTEKHSAKELWQKLASHLNARIDGDKKSLAEKLINLQMKGNHFNK